MKNIILSVIGAVGSFIAGMLGGWDAALITLVCFMLADYVTGWIVAAVFKKSHKTESGGYSSAIGLKGICKKFMILLLIMVAYRLEQLIGGSYIRDGACIVFIGNEAMSILENACLMGIPIPKQIQNALDVLHSKTEAGSDQQ